MRALSRYFGIFIVGIVVCALLGCGTVFNSEVEPAGNQPINALGVYYFLPKTRLRIDGVPGDKGTYAVTVTQVNEPDRNHRYFLRYHRNAMAEDTYTVTVDSKGLLQTLNLQAEDKTPAIINKVADTIISALSAAENAAALQGVREGGTTSTELPFSVVFDPQNYEEYSQAKDLIRQAHFDLAIAPQPNSSRSTLRYSTSDKEAIGGSREPTASELHSQVSVGVFFHPPTTVTVRIAPISNERLRILQVTDIRIPDKDQIAVFELGRLGLVKRTTNLAFTDGNLTSVVETRPSQVLAAVTIPADLAAKVANAIPAIIKIQNENANADIKAETARLETQTQRLNAETERLKAQAALTQQRHNSSSASSNSNRAALEQAQAENAKAQAELLRTRAGLGLLSPTPTPSPTTTPLPNR